MGHLDARYAVPGLMPPNDTNNQMRIVLPEDGSIYMCVHCGRSTDKVTYAIEVWGPKGRRGVVKDPSYNFGLSELSPRFSMYESRWPQFMVMSTFLPDDCQVLDKVVRGDWTVPVTERPCLEEGEKVYWVLDVPRGIIPYGQSVLELCINGRVVRRVLNRPTYAIHNHSDGMMRKLRPLQDQRGEGMDVAFLPEEGGTIRLNPHLDGVLGAFALPDDTEYRAFASFGKGDPIELECSYNTGTRFLHVKVPAGLEPGKGVWKCEYKVWDEWNTLECGDVVIGRP